MLKNGRLLHFKCFGRARYEDSLAVSRDAVYDIASITKVCATTLALMKLYDEGKINLEMPLQHYLPETAGSNKGNIALKQLLLHQAGLVPFISFYKETIDSLGNPLPSIYRRIASDSFPTRVAKGWYLRKDWQDTLFKRVLDSKLETPGKYVYSDNDFILLGKVVERLSGKPLNEYVEQNFYRRMALTHTRFLPWKQERVEQVMPTETEPIFRNQVLQADVHDPGAALMGGVAGHAGLFSNAYDLGILMQCLINKGAFNGHRYIQAETVALFSSYQSSVSRRGLGFDKPEKDNAQRKEPYPCLSASAPTFGHTGFTGTCVWADPAKGLVLVFLSNRIQPSSSNRKLIDLNFRGKILESIYQALY